MNKITIITGEQGIGKSQKAWELVQGKKFHYAESSDLHSAVRCMPIDTEVLIIEDVWLPRHLIRILNSPTVNVRRPYQINMEEISVPDLVITTMVVKRELEKIHSTNVTFIHL
ncbi:MAG: hypothetical protein U0X91_30670 [Spirosomataceae bacterium]